ncbi:MAG: hypothetical protein ABIS50_04605 [Luteolibacter sp.]|uniref:hypothetical protein n=1 Tax=Luteolibacter sp. TaxID=1962973 RepID=UPI003263CF77
MGEIAFRAAVDQWHIDYPQPCSKPGNWLNGGKDRRERFVSQASFFSIKNPKSNLNNHPSNPRANGPNRNRLMIAAERVLIDHVFG